MLLGRLRMFPNRSVSLISIDLTEIDIGHETVNDCASFAAQSRVCPKGTVLGIDMINGMDPPSWLLSTQLDDASIWLWMYIGEGPLKSTLPL